MRSILILQLISNLCLLIRSDDFCYADSKNASECQTTWNKDGASKIRYFLYDVNPAEGFNLRRDVYMRLAVLFHKFSKSDQEELSNFRLVLPPWSGLYHWRPTEKHKNYQWSKFFDLDSMKKFAPVIEMDDFFTETAKYYDNEVIIDEVYILQHFEDMFTTGKFEDKYAIEKCSKNFNLNYFHYDNITARNVSCLSFHGSASKLQPLLSSSRARTMLFHHAEIVLHDMYGNVEYWKARRSMRFNKELERIANKFKFRFLDFYRESHRPLPEDWREEQPNRTALGGPYLAVHIRRNDFLRGRPDQVPDILFIAKQIIDKMIELHLKVVYIATDAVDDEYWQMHEELYGKGDCFRERNCFISMYNPDQEFFDEYGDGGIAIVDQIVCSQARYFIGTHESTFTFRIQEEREIRGFPAETTFNTFCISDSKCPQPSKWNIVY